MTICVGRWDLLPDSWEGINGLPGKAEEEIKAEVYRELEISEEDDFIEIYSPDEFEATLNHSFVEHFSSSDYWIRIFE